MKCWNATGDATVDVPSTLWSGTIWDEWVVTLDTTTPVLNRLTIRGRLQYEYNAGRTLELRAHSIIVQRGAIVMGNRTCESSAPRRASRAACRSPSPASI